MKEANQLEALYFELKTSNIPFKVGDILYCFFLLFGSPSKSIQNIAFFNPDRVLPEVKDDHHSISYNLPLLKISQTANPRNKLSRPHTIHGEINDASNPYKFASKNHLLSREVISMFQGLNGQHLDFSSDGKNIIESFYSPNEIAFAMRLFSLGQNFKTVRDHSAARISVDKFSNGLVSQSFGSALNEEVVDFYKLITYIQSVSHRTKGQDLNVTLQKLNIWSYETVIRFEVLTDIIMRCRNKKGGALVNVVYDFIHNGDEKVRNTARKILSKVIKPIRSMLNHWIFYGELKDEFKEFFICLRDNAHHQPSPNEIWHDKYMINQQMLPGFISKDQANKILMTGKAISMLREVCLNKLTIVLPVFDQLKKSFENSEVESLFNSIDFANSLKIVHREISQCALNILNAKYILHAHFFAFKSYLLFERGDFLNYLLELYTPIIYKPGNKIKVFQLSQTLENAVRKTTAQYDYGEVLSRLDIHLEPCDRSNSDIFSIKYRVDGPINTIFNDRSQKLYSNIFMLFWKVKRVEYMINTNRTSLNYTFLHFKSASEHFSSIFKLFHFYLYQSTCFFKTIQKHFNSLLESNWSIVKNELENPRNLNKLIRVHQVFLHSLSKKLFFNYSNNLNSQYNTILDLIFEFIDKLQSFIGEFSSNLASTMYQNWGDENKEFIDDIDNNYNFWLLNFGKMYEKEIVNFLELLVAAEDEDLKELCFSIDFNRFYKMLNQRS